jgi:hypothetical protein
VSVNLSESASIPWNENVMWTEKLKLIEDSPKLYASLKLPNKGIWVGAIVYLLEPLPL